MIQYEIKITEKVQGVGFRYYAQLKAIEIGITGWVKNSRDGGVAIVAQGDETVINTFLDYMQIGPARARVDDISKYKMQTLSIFKSFVISS